jgi:hypothetical protein
MLKIKKIKIQTFDDLAFNVETGSSGFYIKKFIHNNKNNDANTE